MSVVSVRFHCNLKIVSDNRSWISKSISDTRVDNSNTVNQDLRQYHSILNRTANRKKTLSRH